MRLSVCLPECSLFLLVALAMAACGISPAVRQATRPAAASPTAPPAGSVAAIALFLSGDVMTGRGIDQILPHPSNPTLYESYMTSALGYVALAEQRSGPIPRGVEPTYIWGDALQEWQRTPPDVRLINLETSITTSNAYWPGKAVHYRMHPANVSVLQAAQIDICALANNHVLDWGYDGLRQTLETLQQAGLQTSGAGLNLAQAEAPAIVTLPGKGRLIVFAFGEASSGIPLDWAATRDKPGVHLLPDLSQATLEHIQALVEAVKQPGDVVVASIHWGSNWGYEIPSEQVAFAQQLIDLAGVDVVHGHSSHHVRPIQVYNGKLILYGSGDLINDYEGIQGYEAFRGDLALLYLARIDPQTGALLELRLTPMQIKQFKLNRASPEDVSWLSQQLRRIGEKFGTWVELQPDQSLLLRW